MTAGAIINVAYCLWLLVRNRSAGRFVRGSGWRPWLLASSIGLLWMGAIAAYGLGAVQLGELGPILGWPLFMATIIITANIWGALTGEWRGAGSKAVRSMVVSLIILSVAIFIFGYSSTLQ